MRNWIKLDLILILAVAIIILGSVKPATAEEEAAAFYKGKVLTYVVPVSPGGGYDTYARLMAPFLEKYTGATVVVRNITGGGSIVGTNFTYHAKPDGLTMGIIQGPPMAAGQMLGTRGVKFDLAKFNWLGRPAWDRPVFYVGAKSPYKSVDDVRAAKEFKLGTTGKYSITGFRCSVFVAGMGLTNAKLVHGYAGSAEAQLAVVRGEMDGACFAIASARKILEAGDGVPLITLDDEREPLLPDVPTLFEVGVAEAGKKWVDWWFLTMEKIGRGLVVAPGIPKARIDFLRAAVEKTFKDEDFLARAAKANRPILFLSGEKMFELVQKSMALNKAEIKELDDLLGRY